jgi:hypothetical protein
MHFLFLLSLLLYLGYIYIYQLIFLICCFFFSALWFELRALYLLGKCITT